MQQFLFENVRMFENTVIDSYLAQHSFYSPSRFLHKLSLRYLPKILKERQHPSNENRTSKRKSHDHNFF